MEHGGLLAGFILVILLPQVSPDRIHVEELEDSVFLSCNTSIKCMEGTKGILLAENKTLNLGKRILDPRGKYSCETAGDSAKKVPDLQVYYRTADTQALLRNDQLYQTLQDRDDAQYSRIGGNWARNK
ncbi:T-cell surface glycoprotein CD3 delta chain isoform X2 [Oryctolagus cuniculus]|uniref:T-cell surface glycoprotein CD3 delta chain isoform X2 n=1 Tax=Oryctolagus cuniculus TaxID=9986 RepID=UPI0022329C1F|nr:T-cell surface glycoprotein CD3 delta chain isoform X2 [Oryctolagus cuniculus]